MTIHQILTKYWGHASFRPLQEDIIQSVISGKDTLALLPTGGGKSVCFQVPAIYLPGLCIVVTPLIALMKDQVDNLKKKSINAIAVYSGMRKDEIDIALDNCVYGDVKFLYISPERLRTEMFVERLKKMKVSLIAVDEAHCISQWGYDFRPPYLQIAVIRDFLPQIPVIALTATATRDVVLDIQQKLLFKKENVFLKSFERKNLTYFVFNEEDKYNRILRIVNKVQGTGIIYVRNRRKTKEISDYLIANGIKSDFYHAGLDPSVREQKQESWINSRIRIMVCTNAFGMGIDKPDVRLVIHFEPPDNLEAYFQEAGRAGRDEKNSYAVLLYNETDLRELQHRFELAYPDIDYVKQVYDALGTFLNIPLGNRGEDSINFDLNLFSESLGHNPVKVFSALKILEKNGFIVMTEALHQPSKIMFKLDKDDLYRFQMRYSGLDPLIKAVLRSYPGVFSVYARINENEIARRLGVAFNEVVKGLLTLDSYKVISYIPQTNKPQLVFLTERVLSSALLINHQDYNNLKETALKRQMAVVHYLNAKARCRSQLLLDYFGDLDAKRCGKCDICLKRNIVQLSDLEFDEILELIKPMLKSKALSHNEIIQSVGKHNADKTLKVIQFLLDNGKIRLKDGLLFWN